jgi:hypothetical protein
VASRAAFVTSWDCVLILTSSEPYGPDVEA